MKIDICQQGRGYPALWRSDFGSVKTSVFHISRFEKGPNQREESLICNLLSEDMYQLFVRNRVKTPFYVSFYDPEVFSLLVTEPLEMVDCGHC